MNKKLCVYTCITGDYDNLHEIKYPEKTIDYYCFTNNKSITSKTWRVIYVKDAKLDNRNLARKIKILGHEIVNKYETAVWTDASIVWEQPFSKFVKTYLKNAPLAMFRHHARENIFEEAVACLKYGKDTKERITKLLDYYQTEQYPDTNGLFESTVFIKKPSEPKVIEAMQLWFDFIENYSPRDQLSFPYVVWKTGLKVNPIDLNVWENSWFYATSHSYNYNFDNCSIYYGNPDQDFDFNKYFTFSYKKSADKYSLETTVFCDTDEIEINPTNLPGVSFENIDFKPTVSRFEVLGATTYGQRNAFCSGHNTIRFYGNFKKGQKLTFSIILKVMSPSELIELSGYLWAKNSSLLYEKSALETKNIELQSKNTELQTHLDSILNSKAWKSIELTRKIIHPIKSKS